MPVGALSRWVLRSAAHCTVPEHTHHLTTKLVIRRCRNPPCPSQGVSNQLVLPYCLHSHLWSLWQGFSFVLYALNKQEDKSTRKCTHPLTHSDSSLVPGDHGKEGRFLSCGEDLGDVDGRRERLVQTSPAKTALSTNVCGRGCLATVVEEGRPHFRGLH